MRTLLFFLLIVMTVILGLTPIESNEYWAETTSLDDFEVIENGKSRMIHSYRSNNTKFEFSCKDPRRTFIRMHCETCEVDLTLKLFGVKEDAYTDWIKLRHGQKISLEECFKKYPKKTKLHVMFSNAADILYDFWASLNNGRTARKRGGALKGNNTTPGDPKLEFLKTDYHFYLTIQGFSIQFRSLDKFPVKSIYIISNEGELIFHAGSRDVLMNVFDISKKPLLPIPSVLKINQSKESETIFELAWKDIEPHLFYNFEPGKEYQLGVDLENDTSEHDPYLFNFLFFSPEEVEEMKRFIDHD